VLSSASILTIQLTLRFQQQAGGRKKKLSSTRPPVHPVIFGFQSADGCLEKSKNTDSFYVVGESYT